MSQRVKITKTKRRVRKIGGNSEFLDAIANTDIDTLLATVDELMDCLALINPKLYNTVLAKLRG